MKNHMVALAAVAGVFGGIAAANAEPVPVVVDDEMNARFFRVDENWRNGGTSTIERAFSDDAVGVYCEWSGTAEVDFDARTITNVQTGETTCKISEAADTEQWAGGRVYDVEDVLTDPVRNLEPDPENGVVVERGTNGPNNFNVVSEFKRTWNFAAGEVCLYMEEGFHEQEPYSAKDLGCYDIPDNDHVDEIRAVLQP